MEHHIKKNSVYILSNLGTKNIIIMIYLIDFKINIK